MRFITPQWRPSARKRRTASRNVIDVSAFASAMFALLFLMIIGIPPQHPMVIADLPRASNPSPKPGALREDAMVVAIARDGILYFRNSRILATDLPTAIRAAVRNGAEQTVYIKADARAKYADVNTVLDRIRQSNLQNITFLTDRRYAVSTP